LTSNVHLSDSPWLLLINAIQGWVISLTKSGTFNFEHADDGSARTKRPERPSLGIAGPKLAGLSERASNVKLSTWTTTVALQIWQHNSRIVVKMPSKGVKPLDGARIFVYALPNNVEVTSVKVKLATQITQYARREALL